MSGPLPITSHDMLAYFHLHGVDRTYWSTISDFVIHLDELWLEEYGDAAEEAQRVTHNKGAN